MGSAERTFEWNWACKTTFDPLEIQLCRSELVKDHPLMTGSLSTVETKLPKKESTLVFMDPLSSGGIAEDPLSAMAAKEDWDDLDEVKPLKMSLQVADNPWIEQRAAILTKFTTNQKLSIASGFLQGTDKVSFTENERGELASPRTRLQQLDDFFDDESVRQMEHLSQSEYVDTINQFGKELVTAWNQDFRVKALKIAIQCAKLLVDTSVVQFYPSKFVLITDVLDLFGNLVYERLLTKAEYFPPGSRILSPLPENFTPDMVPELAKETCRNWFYKIASIRELIPRLYVEAAVLKSYTFLTNSELSECVNKLTMMTQGIGDPLVAVYTRCYLCRIGQNLYNAGPHLIKHNLLDFINLYEQLSSPYVIQHVTAQKVEIGTYLGTFVPALDWMFQGIVNSGDRAIIDQLFTISFKKGHKGLLINSILSTYKSEYIAVNAHEVIHEIVNCFGESFGVDVLLKTMGDKMRNEECPEGSKLRRKVWQLLSKLNNDTSFLSATQAWALFIINNSTTDELNEILGDILDRIGNNKGTPQLYSTLQDIIINVASNISNIDLLFTMDKFLPLVDVLPSRGTTCQKLLETYCKSRTGVISDPVTTDALMFIAKLLHDSVNALTVDDEKRQYGQLISHLVQKIEFGEFEQQLRFYVEARATFMNLDTVIVTLVHCVNRLAMERGRKVKGHHTRRTAAFVRACSAYSYITIPSLTSEVTRLRLYLVTAQLSLANQSLGQADACITSALSLLSQLPLTIEVDGKMTPIQPFLREYVRNMLSTLLVVPDCPDEGVLYLSRGLINMLQQCDHLLGAGYLATLYTDAISMLSVAARPEYPYHVKKVDSNDVLYGSDPKFIAEINKMCSILLEEVLNNLQVLGEQKDFVTQSEVLLVLFEQVLDKVRLESEGMTKLAYQIWLLANKHRSLDDRLITRMVNSWRKRLPSYPANSPFSLLLSKLKVS